MNRKNEFIKSFRRRSFILSAIKLLFLSSLGMRFYYLQIMSRKKYTIQSNNNCIKTNILFPRRGLILDRNDIPIVQNEKIYNLIIESYNFNVIKSNIDLVNEVIPDFIKLSDRDIIRIIRLSFIKYNVILKYNISFDDLSKISFYSYKFPLLQVEKSSIRIYKYPYEFSYITGYIGKNNRNKDQDYIDFSGKSGVEKIFNKTLKGSPGFLDKEIDPKGAFIKNLNINEPKNGDNINLSLDVDLQKYIFKRIKEFNGCSIVMNVNSGHIISATSTPGYDPNILLNERNKFFKGNWDCILNKAIQSTYPPGSTFKLISSLALLSNRISSDEEVYCNGYHIVGDRIFRCWKRSGHGSINMNNAIAKSCNVYFYKMSQYISIEDIYKIAIEFGLGTKTNIELTGEKSGTIPNSIWKKKYFNKNWYKGDTVNAMIGQGYVSLTPIQMAVMTSRIATGKNVSPTILSKRKAEFTGIKCDTSYLNIIRNAMFHFMNKSYGLGYKKRLKDIAICSKTGTSQITSLDRSYNKNRPYDHGIFVSYAPYNNPEYTVVTVIENSKWGSNLSLPISIDIFKKLKNMGYL